ncbi:DUF411 domain-containing protein [Fodinibius sediminis]|uniref:Uncharacterized conserved protein n=1 Tax=Fodinibius sediminis TaxID=1214077 RepID=A0A521ACG3_9BACT|nr:DUF411 domain-containing protein [Fodinibius sediminis]SMO32499.1 Uncharacterized conserved protein [Fodinibius sediminis]
MKPTRFFAYAGLVIVAAGAAIWYIINNYYERQAQAQTTAENQVVMYKNPGCQCCTEWAQHMEQAGFAVTERPTGSLPAVKADHDVPYNLGSCHTALVNGYVVEGHVPVKEVKKLIRERPDAVGLAVPGMPIGSPGMEQGSRTEPYDVILFDEEGNRKTYASY